MKKFTKKVLSKSTFIRKTVYKINNTFMGILVRISPVLASKYIYRIIRGKKLKLNNPHDFNEKIHWLKLYWQHPLVAKCADKYELRSYVEDCGCKEILNDLYGVYDSSEEINWSNLPQKFVLKTSNGCDTNIICKDKSKLDKTEALKKLKDWMKIDFGLIFAEIHYSKMTPRIICEKYLETDTGDSPNDYKLFCFNGEPKFLYVGVVDQYGYTHKTYYDFNWNKLNFLKQGYKSLDHRKPTCLEDMVKYATILSKPFPMVRIDFYDYNGVPILGEMTFTPTGGLANYYQEDVLEMLGDWINLPPKYISK
ncbi:glycosyltransferase [Sutcliffiella horikoshii]|uniref:ATP-grasp fold amidoligase family protein n=1 Tax=Sutcliffiella horikoshii TaxID=79883 RepID=UPI0020422645|nr:ATP-grasp fold amidoligase family protein [Sutcliffiella horikoshii]MCM3617919.1 glycosyltransferase [Sutcliffiella horikoshii]